MKKKPYKAYLIRCWHVDPETHPNQNEWRFSLESVDGEGGRYGFTDPQDLLSFLTKQIEDHEIELVTENGDAAPGFIPGNNEATS